MMTLAAPCIDGTRAHRMRFETPCGPEVAGTCKRCGGTERLATAGPDGLLFDVDKAAFRTRERHEKNRREREWGEGPQLRRNINVVNHRLLPRGGGFLDWMN